MVRNLRSGLRQSLKPSVAGGLGDNDIFTTASLDLNFAKYKNLGTVDATTGQNLVDFSRASSGTYVGSDGLIKTAVTNLLLRSEEFNTTWTPNFVLVTPNATIAPDGTLTADKISDTADFQAHFVTQIVTCSSTCVFSVFVKAAELSTLSIRPGNAGNFVNADINLSTQSTSVTTGGTGSNGFANVTPIGNGWFRCVVGGTGIGNGQVAATIYLNNDINYSGSGQGIYIWGAQLEQSTTVGEYIKTTSTINSAPRFDHDPTTGESLGLLVEELRTNLVTNSETIGGTGWKNVGNGSSVVTLNHAVAPDGTETATKIDFSRVDTTKYRLTAPSSAISATDLTQGSVYVKAATSSDVGKVIDLWQFQGEVRNQSTATLTNTWQRVSLVNTYSHTGSINEGLSIGLLNDAGGGELNVSVLLWGAQLEAGSFPTSYIPTQGAEATRSADVAVISGSNFSSWYRQDEGSAFVDFTVNGVIPASNHFVYDFNDGTINEEIFLNYQPSGNARWVARVPSNQVTQDSLGSSLDRVKHAFGMISDDYMAARDGSLSTGSSQSGMPAVTSLKLGNRFNEFFPYNGTIRRLCYWNQRLPNSTLQTITQ